MELLSYGCTGYKPFRERATVELRPLTLLLGRNNSGKTALARLPRLLLQALSAEAPRDAFPLEAPPLSFGRLFRDVIHGGHPHGAVEFEIACREGDERLELRATVQNVQKLGSRDAPPEYTVVSRIEVSAPDHRLLEWEPRAEVTVSYKGHGKVSFRGLWPEGLADWPFADEWRERVRPFKAGSVHLGPLRAEARSTYEVEARRPLSLSGGEAVGWIAADDTLRQRVSAWLEEHLEGWRLELDFAGSAYRCLLSRGAVRVNLCDVGQGIQQVLPVVVHQLARQAVPAAFLDVVEQPELHLHASAQAPLGDLFLAAARRSAGVTLVETHSENLLLRIRRRIAEGVDPELVALYWLDNQDDACSVLRRIHIDRQGEVDFWPEGVFAEGYEEVTALRRAARVGSNT